MPTSIPTEALRWGHTVPAGTHWSCLIRKGHAIRFTDLEGGANCALTFFNPTDPLERYNMPDTLKAQHTALLTRGHCLYSDMGRIFASIITPWGGTTAFAVSRTPQWCVPATAKAITSTTAMRCCATAVIRY